MHSVSDGVCGYSTLPFHEAFQHGTRQNNRVHWAIVFRQSVLAVHSSKTQSIALVCFGPECMSIHLNHPAQIQTGRERKEDPRLVFVLQLVQPISMLSLLAPLQVPSAQAQSPLMSVETQVEAQARELSCQISRCSAPASMLSPAALMTGRALIAWRPHSPLLPSAQLLSILWQARRSTPPWRMLHHFLLRDERKVLLSSICPRMPCLQTKARHPRTVQHFLLPGLPILPPLSLIQSLRKALIQASATHSYRLQLWQKCQYHCLLRLGLQLRMENEHHGCQRDSARALQHAGRLWSRTQELHTQSKLLRLVLLYHVQGFSYKG